MEQTIVTHILQAFPTTQAIYLFGSFGSLDERPASDIDIANRVVRLRRLGSPRESRESFVLLAEAGIIDTPMLRSMLGMVEFRNILVHQDTRIDPTILQSVMTTQVSDTLVFAQAMAMQPE